MVITEQPEVDEMSRERGIIPPISFAALFEVLDLHCKLQRGGSIFDVSTGSSNAVKYEFVEVLVKISRKVGHDLNELVPSLALAHFTANRFGDELGPQEDALGSMGKVAYQIFG